MDYTDIVENAERFAGKKGDTENYDVLFVDRLHHRYTVAILICFFVALSTYQYVGDPLRCWVPPQFTDNYEAYTNLLCFIQNTYHVEKHEALPRNSTLRYQKTLKYYQWISFLLLFQSLFFYLPHFLWQSFKNSIGLSTENLIDASNQYDLLDDDREKNQVIQYICDCMQRYEEYVNPIEENELNFYQRTLKTCRSCCGARTGASLAYFYVFIKCLYILNIIGQLTFLQYFLSYQDISYFQFGLNVFQNIFSKFSLNENKLFPRITLCDFQIRELTNRHQYTVECLLTTNIFIEKFYFILWIWLAILLFITIADITRAIYHLFVKHARKRFIIYNLELIMKDDLVKDKQFPIFFRYFPIDNILLLWIIQMNTSSLVVANILHEIFQRKLSNPSEI